MPPGGSGPASRPGLPPRTADLGELALLARIAARVGAQDERVAVGIGDDAAALHLAPGSLALFTADALVEGVHFQRTTSGPADIGWKALAINASDVAAMGGRPRHAVVSLMLPDDLEVAWVDGFYDGLLEYAGRSGISVVGGNLAQAPLVIVDMALLGEVEPQRLMRRAGARPGDLVAVTGALGGAAAGLVALREGMTDPPGQTLIARAVYAQRRPEPPLAAGPLLAASGAVHAMIDLSDGLAIDLWRVCEASGVGVRIEAERLPVDPAAAAVAAAAQCSALEMALSGGEDYELLFAVAPSDAGSVLDRLVAETGRPAAVIGEFTPASAGRRVVGDGGPRPLTPSGWTHFRVHVDPHGE